MEDRAALPTPERLRALLAQLGEGLLERETAIRLALLAALAGEHLLLIGPPGTAKSELARRLHGVLSGTRYFERLLTRFSTPEELFGPLSLKALEHDRYERLADGFLPTAGVAFLDEVFKANSAILNALLTLLNEREFDNGTARVAVPLVSVIGASNELPADEALQAFYDRFLLRVPVQPVGDASFAALLALPGERGVAPGVAAPLGPAERQAVTAAAGHVALGADFVDACGALRGWLAERSAALSDRRWRQFVGLARTAAAAEGRAAVDRLDLWLAPFVAAARPQDVPALEAWFIDDAAAAPPPEAPWLRRAVEAFEQQLGLEQRAPAEAGDDRAGKLAHAPGLDGAAQRVVSQRLEARLARHWSPVHIAARVAQVAEIEQQVGAQRDALEASLAALQSSLAPRLWMPTALKAHLLARHEQALAVQRELHARLVAVREGFAALPCDAALPGEAPPAVPVERAAQAAA
ncbi:AAA family ATPase [Caldimonas sp. KR1-144]|uniref:AAA family ATPase n=1 Tax=Caldimonas sp. KR1-144 TaxID=3400911 RepID=UPI003BFF7328